jgi:murein DD-endopeptidase MepM/ murein hydrolase activator NlpD
VTRVSEKDAKLIADLSGSIVELNSLNNELEAKKTELEAKEEELNTQMTSLSEKQESLEANKDVQENKKSDVTDKQNEVKYLLEDLDKDSDAYKAAIARKEKERAALEAQIEAAIKDNGSNEGDTPDEDYNNDGKMLWPVPGETRLTATYPSYSDGTAHWGIDIVRTDVTTKGSPFRAAQGGKVIAAYNDGNWNYGFGNYCIIDHGDGKHTLYAHAQTLYVSEGDVVQKGQQIGLIGDTGNTTGPHLHFEVRIKKSDGSVSRVNPLNYVSKP